MPLTVDVDIPLGLSLTETVQFAQRAEALGFHGVGVADHLGHGRDAFAALTLIAAQTSRITLYPSATNPVTRHPHVLGDLVTTLTELAPGRVKLVLAPGDGGVRPSGRRPATVAEVRDAVLAIRRLLREGSVPEGTVPTVHRASAGGPPPVAVVASRPRMTELAGEVGDEAILMAGLDGRMLELAGHHLKSGARRSGRSLVGFRVTHYTLVAMAPDAAQARERAREWLHLWLRQGQFSAALRAVGVDVPPFEGPGDIPDDLLTRLCDLLFVAGTPEACAERLQRLEAQGVKHLACMLPGGAETAWRTMAALAEVLQLQRGAPFGTAI